MTSPVVMNQPTAERFTPEVVAALEGMRARLMPLRYNIGDLHHKTMMNPGNPPSWPETQKSIALLNSHIHSIINFINGHTTTGPTSREIPPQAPLLRQLHPYPTPPFSFDGGMAGLVETLLRKKAGPKEDKWVEDRLGKAAEFCYVPADLGVEVKAPAVDEQEDEEDQEEMEGGFKPTKVERRKGALTEDELMEIWSDAGNQGAIGIHRFENPDDDEEEGSEEEDEDEMEDVEMGENGALKVEGGKGATTGTAAKPVGLAPLPLNVILKFMGTGTTGTME